MVLVSKVGISKSGSGVKSARTTIPKGIVEYLGLQHGDKIEWLMSANWDKEGKSGDLIRHSTVRKRVQK